MTRKTIAVTLVLSKSGRKRKAVFAETENLRWRLMYFQGKGGDNVSEQIKRKESIKTCYWSMVGMSAALILSMQPVFADTIWDRFSTIMRDVYGQIVGISTIVAVTAAAIALIVRMISRNQRAVDEASSWLKRIVVTWIILNSLGFIVAYLQPLIEGGAYTG